jgi:hypothetical protein
MAIRVPRQGPHPWCCPRTIGGMWHGPDALWPPGEQERLGRARQERAVAIPVTAGSAALKVVTADVAFGPGDLREWTEALVAAK